MTSTDTAQEQRTQQAPDAATEATRALVPFVDAGILGTAEVHFVRTMARANGGLRPLEGLAAALALRAVQHGHVRLDLADVADTVAPQSPTASAPTYGVDGDELAALPWPDPTSWSDLVRNCELVRIADHTSEGDNDRDPMWRRPFVWADDTLYLDRYHRFEQAVTHHIRTRLTRPASAESGDVDRGPKDPIATQIPTAAPPTHPPSDPFASSFQPSLFDDISNNIDPQVGTADTSAPHAARDHRDPPATGIAASPALAAEQASLVDRLFDPTAASEGQRRAARTALDRRFTVIAGGPGTGKTYTVARILAILLEADHRAARSGSVAATPDTSAPATSRGSALQVGLAAPTGKAAARMTQAIREAAAQIEVDPTVSAQLLAAEATTLHRLLGAGHGGFRHDANNPLPHDVIIIDETSMVSLPDMARLLGATRPDAQLVLVGDPDQLESIEAGSVLSDIVAAAEPGRERGGARTGGGRGGEGPDAKITGAVVNLERVHRFGSDSAIAELADAIRAGDTDAVEALIDDDTLADLTWVDPENRADMAALTDRVVDNAIAMLDAATDGEDRGASALAIGRTLHTLCATRRGPGSVEAWGTAIELGVARRRPDIDTTRRWYVGRPILVRANDPVNRLVNGDVGVVVAAPDEPGPQVAFEGPDGMRLVPAVRLDAVDTLWAMTIHKSQGSEFDHVVVSLPHADSRMLTRQLLYTAVTRARRQVTIVGQREAIRRSVQRSIPRASGLKRALSAV